MCRVVTDCLSGTLSMRQYVEHTDCVSSVAGLRVKRDEIRLIRKSDSSSQLNHALSGTTARKLCTLTLFFSLIYIIYLF